MNAAACEVMERHWKINYVGPISPGVSQSRKAISKFRRMMGWKGDFFFFSHERLSRIGEEALRLCDPSASLDFFHGFTPWILSEPLRPYVAWSDCIFSDYLEIYHRASQFGVSDIQRIKEAEAAWLNKAERVLFTSEWAARNACETYGLPTSKVGVVGLFGEIEPPIIDDYQGGRSFLFVSTNFEAKGGPAVLAAFREVRQKHPDATLSIVGDSPPDCRDDGVDVRGYLRKEVPEDVAQLRQLFASARAVVHPTRSDILPLMLIEAGYFGVPVIASRRFAIPELITDGVNGVLIDGPDKVQGVEAAMESLLLDDHYDAMRKAAWRKANSDFSKEGFELRLAAELKRVLGTRL